MTFVSTDPVTHQGETNTWLTPLRYIEALGKFDLDPCAFPNHNTAKNMICLPDDGLSSEWKGRVWLNPPYGEYTKEWVLKLKEHGNGIALIFARTDTIWMQEILPFADAICFLKGRIRFLNERFETKTTAGAPSCLLAFGKKNVEALSNLSGIVFKKEQAI